MAVVVGRIKKGAYFDSVTLMTVGKKLGGLPGVIDAAIVMGTKENKSILAASGLLTAEFEAAVDTDLVIAISVDSATRAEEVLAGAEAELEAARQRARSAGRGAVERPRSLEGALRLLPDANMVVISVAGRHAAAEARKALDAGLHVMLFSDNVTLEQEVELKRLGRERGLLVMGPDCGTAIINGVPLAFANVVGRGSIGIVAAAGTGCQEVSTLIANEGAGVSQAIGTGGRDVKKDVGGIMFLEALKALAEDEPTKVILLVSKPPHADVLKQIETVIAGIRKPVVPFFLGAARSDPASPATLEEAALMAVALSRGDEPGAVRKRLSARDEDVRLLARREAGKLKKGQRYLRGLFSGGTFCSEAQILFEGVLDGVHSNAPAGKARKLENSLRSVEHSVVDLGEDEFTVGRPHPMIDYSLRRKRIAEEAADPSVAVILLDVVLGYGSHLDPASELVEPIRQAVTRVSVVCSVTGTDRDPQNRAAVVAALEQAGALVMPSNAAACKLAATIAQYVKE